MNYKKALKKLYKLEKKKTFPLTILRKWYRGLSEGYFPCPCSGTVGCLITNKDTYWCLSCERTVLYRIVRHEGVRSRDVEIRDDARRRLLEMIQKIIRRVEKHTQEEILEFP